MAIDVASYDAKLKITRESALGVAWLIRGFAVSMLDLQTRDVASGTLLTLGKRVFVATAAHAIPKEPVGRLWLINRTGRHETDGFPGFVRWNRHPDSTIDVGYLELDAATAAEYFGHGDFCTIDNTANLGVGRKGRGVIVIGTPSANVRASKPKGRTVILRFETMPYWTVPLMRQDWPKVDREDRRPDHAVDVFLDYPADECRVLETNAPTTLPDAPGMSGGGVWDQGFATKQIWSPGDCKLFGILSSWSSTRRYLRATQLTHWVELIRNDYPDLRRGLRGWQ